MQCLLWNFDNNPESQFVDDHEDNRLDIQVLLTATARCWGGRWEEV